MALGVCAAMDERHLEMDVPGLDLLEEGGKTCMKRASTLFLFFGRSFLFETSKTSNISIKE